MSEEKEQPQVELTEEQIKERTEAMAAQKRELTQFYKKELPLLRLQTEYEECLAKIDVAKMQRFEIMMAKAQMMAGEPEVPQDKNDEPEGNRTGEHRKPAQEPTEEPVERQLKKV
jgi:hypothetical protein